MKIFQISYNKDNRHSYIYVGGESLGVVLVKLHKEYKTIEKCITNIFPIEVGTGATYGVGSDCYPYTVVEIINEKKVVVQADDYEPDEGFDYYGNQVYKYKPNKSSRKVVITLRKNQTWLPVGSTISYGGCYMNGFSLGYRRAYRNPSF